MAADLDIDPRKKPSLNLPKPPSFLAPPAPRMTPVNPASKPGGDDYDPDEEQRRAHELQRQGRAQAASINPSRDERKAANAVQTFNRTTPGVLGASFGGQGKSPDALWNSQFKRPAGAQGPTPGGATLDTTKASAPRGVAVSPAAATPGREALLNSAVKPDGYVQTSLPEARAIARNFAAPANPADPKNVAIGTGQRAKLDATPGVPGLSEPGEAKMQLGVAEMKAQPGARVRLDNFAGGMTNPNAINEGVAQLSLPGSDPAASAKSVADAQKGLADAQKVTDKIAASGRQIFPANPADEPEATDNPAEEDEETKRARLASKAN